MALINGRTDFDEQFFSKNTSVSKGTDIFSLGGDFFTIKTNLEDRKIRDLTSNLENFSDPVTLDTLIVKKDVQINIDNFISVTLNLDKTELTNHAYFGSLRDKFEFSILNIINTFPASLYINNDYNDVLYTILDYQYNEIANRASMRVPVNAISNFYGLKTKRIDNKLLSTTDELRNVAESYGRYSLWNFNEEFPLVSYTGNTDSDNYLYITVLGNPFIHLTGSTLTNFHIKPNYDNYVNFLAGLDEFQSYLLNRDDAPKYTATFKVPNEDNEGNTLLVDQTFTWKTTDGYNLDYDTFEFQIYTEALINLAQSLDDYKTNLVSRYLTASAIKEFDTPDQRTDKLLKLYGKEFDEIKQYIDGLANLTKVSYDKKDNMPDVLVKNFARTLGWGTFSTVNEKNLMKSFLGQDNDIVLSGEAKNLTPAEADIELWRRLVVNSAFLFRSKGTRECIDFLFKIVGAPKSLIEFNEYIYIAKNKIDVSAVLNTPDLNFPFDSEGYPAPVPNREDYWFQMNGGWISNKEIAPTNHKNYLSVVGIHTGQYDRGVTYFKAFTDFNGSQGFDLDRIPDNVKSWKRSQTSHVNLDRETNYKTDDSRFVLNSKEASIFMSPAKAVETDVYEYNKETGFVINPVSLPYPYPDNELTRADVTKMSFLEYIDFIYTRFINAKNRKVIETFGNGYPTLKRLYEDYYNAKGESVFTEEYNEPFEDIGESQRLTTNKVLQFVDQIGDFWINLIEQFVPSTTIWQGGVEYRNTIFDRQKFDYKQGVNDGSEFETEQLPNPDIIINAAQATATVSLPYEAIIEDIVVANILYSSNLNFPDDGGGIDNSGSTSILRVKPFWDHDSLTLTQPCVDATQISPILTGKTEPIIHDISLGNKEIDFTFNCNTDFFTLGGKFKYTIYPFDYTNRVFTTGATYSKLFNLIIPSGGIAFVHEVVNYSFTDGDYLVKPGFRYELLLTGNTHANIKGHFKRLAEVGLISDTGFVLNGDTLIFDSTNIQPTRNLGIYNDESDWWFQIISPPFKPAITNVNFVPGNFSGSTLVNKTIDVTSNLQKVFIINEVPNGDIFFTVNGSTLLKSAFANFSDGGEYFGEVVGATYKITLNPDIDVYVVDVVNVIYIKSSNDSGSFDSIYKDITVIPSGTTATDGILYNTNTGLFEYYLPFELNATVNFDEMVIVLNGSVLNKTTDYFMSPSNPNKIIFNGPIQVGDTLLIYYPSATQLNNFLPDKSFIAMWKVQNDNKTGKYTVEVSENSNFATIIMTKSTAYMPLTPTGFNNYILEVGDFTVPNKKYYFRIKSEKNNINLLGETTITTMYSNTMYFLTDNRVLG